MALQVWLPLNGDLTNNGLTNANITNSNATISNDGKIGKCYSFNGSSQKLTSTLPLAVSSSIGTLACWVKFNAFPASGKWMCLMQLGTSGGFAACRLGVYMEYTNGINICIDGSSTAGNLYTHSLSTNTWYHLCATNDGTNVKLYLNGEAVLSKVATKGTYTTSAPNLYIGGTNNYYLNGCLNDVRYYDTCLSSKEVEILARGLVLHYPMTGGGRGCANLVPNQANFTSVTPKTLTTTNTDGNSWLSGSAFEVTPSTTYTFSVCCDGQIATKHATDGSEPGTFSMWLYLCNDGTTKNWQGGGYDSPICFTSSNYNHKQVGNRHIWQYTTTSTQRYMSIRLNNYGPGTVTNHYWEFKIEKGSIFTPYIPNVNESQYNAMGYNSTTEYDVSGYNYHGNKTGTITYSSDTPRYEVSSNFTDPAYITYKLPKNMYYATYAFWVKSPSYTVYGAINMQSGNPSGGDAPWFSINTEDKALWMFIGNNSPAYCDVPGSLNVNTWYHCAMVWDNGVAQWYLNGEKFGNAVTFTKKYLVNSTTATIGDSYTGTSWNGTPFSGNISDWRVYATALTATQIKELYNTSVSISNNGTLLGYEFVEA